MAERRNYEYALALHRERGGETARFSSGKLMCCACCWGDRCDEPRHYYRDECPLCLGTGVPQIDEEATDD